MQFTDQLENTIIRGSSPLRIVSLVPSQTELLYDLGLDEEIAGITNYCIHPKEWRQSKTKIGGPKKINFEKIRQLKPNLIIGNKEENLKNEIEVLQKEFPVWMSDIYILDEALQMIIALGELVEQKEKAIKIATDIQTAFSTLPKLNKYLSVVYLIWQEPFIAVGKNTFIDHILGLGGFSNVVTTSRYPEITKDIIKQLKPKYIFLSSEPYPFKEKHRIKYQEVFPDSKVVLTDGELFSWYGSRLLHTPKYMEQLLRNL